MPTPTFGPTRVVDASPPAGVRQLPAAAASLIGVTHTGDLLVRLVKSGPSQTTYELSSELYLYEIREGRLKFLVQPTRADLQIRSALLRSDLLLWCETTDTGQGSGWRLHLTDTGTNEDILLAEDDLGKANYATSLYPREPFLGERYILWKQYKRNGSTLDCHIYLYDLSSKEKRSIVAIAQGGIEKQLDSPTMMGNVVVFGRSYFGDAKPDPNRTSAYGDVFLYDLVAGKEEQITDNGSSLSPISNDRYIVWQYRQTFKNNIGEAYGELELYDPMSRRVTRITSGKPHQEYFAATIGARAVAMNSNEYDSAEIYDLDKASVARLDTGYVDEIYTNANVVAWRWNYPSRGKVNPLDRRIRFTVLE